MVKQETEIQYCMLIKLSKSHLTAYHGLPFLVAIFTALNLPSLRVDDFFSVMRPCYVILLSALFYLIEEPFRYTYFYTEPGKELDKQQHNASCVCKGCRLTWIPRLIKSEFPFIGSFFLGLNLIVFGLGTVEVMIHSQAFTVLAYMILCVVFAVYFAIECVYRWDKAVECEKVAVNRNTCAGYNIGGVITKTEKFFSKSYLTAHFGLSVLVPLYCVMNAFTVNKNYKESIIIAVIRAGFVANINILVCWTSHDFSSFTITNPATNKAERHRHHFSCLCTHCRDMWLPTLIKREFPVMETFFLNLNYVVFGLGMVELLVHRYAFAVVVYALACIFVTVISVIECSYRRDKSEKLKSATL